jgi:hypothetical protein
MRFPKHLVTLSFLLSFALPALPCTCVVAANSNAKTAMVDVSIVFRGTVLERKALPQRSEMRGRRRYAITFRVDEYWKGPVGRTVIIYGVDNGTDCLGDGGYEVGRNYLVYVAEEEVKDIVMEDGFFWYGWTDVLLEGTKMLVPRTACEPGGETSAVRKAIRELGKGRMPAKTE